MQSIKAAVAVFCTACICAELVTQVTQSGWARRCIKAVAGLYILAVALRALPQAKAEWKASSVPAASAVSLGTLEEAVLSQTKADLSKELEARCREELGVTLTLELALAESSDGVIVTSAQATPEGSCTTEQRRAAEQLLQQALGVLPQWQPPGGES